MPGSGPYGDDPLGYQIHWLAYNGPGGTSIGASVNLGQQNDLGIANPGDEGATIITIQDSRNAAFAAMNCGGNPPDPSDPSQGGVGVFGQSVAGGIWDETPPLPDPPPALTAGIGVAGQCNTGAGVYGQSIFGAGVTGSVSTSHTGWATWGPKLEKTFQKAGVLGRSEFGPGVRGHGIAIPPPVDPNTGKPDPFLIYNPDCAPGGVFSTGWTLDVVDVGGGPDSQDVSKLHAPQLRLVPFKGVPKDAGNVFPLIGMVGDFFFAFTFVDQNLMGPVVTAELFICRSIDFTTQLPVWSKVVTVDGNSALPTPGLGGTPIS